jgi:glycosyltransferase EpsE
MYKATVFIPVFNTCGRWFRSCLNSVLAEEGNFQILVVDDGSTNPETLAVLEEYEHRERVRVIRHSKNRGIAAACLTGRMESRTELFLRFDSDDIMVKGRVAKQIAYMRAHPEVAVMSGQARFMDENGNLLLWTTGLEYNRKIPIWKQANPIVNPAAIMRRSVLSAIGGHIADDYETDDFELWCRLEYLGYMMVVLNETFVYYRYHMTKETEERRRIGHQKIVQKYLSLEQARRLGCSMLL